MAQPPEDPSQQAVADGNIGAQALQAVVEATLRDLHSGAPGLATVQLDSRLDSDLGLDSLTRVELLLRAERRFGVELPEDTLQRAETVGDLLKALQAAQAAPPRPEHALARAAARERPGPQAAEGVGVGVGVGGGGGGGGGVGSRVGVDVDGPIEAAAAMGSGGHLDAADAAPSNARTLLDVLAWHVNAHPDRVQVTCLADDTEHPVTYGQLAAAAAATAAGLRRAGVLARQCVAIMLPTSADYFGTYFGILMAGAIPVPIYPPARASQLEDHVLRHAGILSNAQAVLLVTVADAMVVARLLQARVPGLRHVATPAQLMEPGGAAPALAEPQADGLANEVANGLGDGVAVQGEDIAFIQYTSGSTGAPKGVALTHANLLANIRAMVQVAQATPRDVFVSWLPLYHDMGLIGSWLAGLYMGFPLVVMSPLAFLARPQRWLEAVAAHRGTLSAAPNFAYELCLKHTRDADLQGLDLSSWRLAFNGAEAVSPDTVHRFQERFAACGLRPEAVAPVYGLAESCVGLLFPPLGRRARVDSIQRDAFSRAHRAVPAAPVDATSLRFVACGRALPGHAIRILDDDGREVGERVEGHLEFKGPSATHGYFRNPEETARLKHDGWLDTGDRAYLAEGDVFITGRVKDIVIRGGRNLYPQEIEEAVGVVPGVRKGCVAVFGRPDPATGTEQLVVLAEVQALGGGSAAQGTEARLNKIRREVTDAVLHAIGEPPDQVVLAPPRTVLKTSSGKVRRSACRALFESGQVGSPARTPRQQLLHLAFGALVTRVRHAAANAGRWLFGLYAVLLFVLLGLPTWLLTLLMPTPRRAWRLDGHVTRLLLWMTATPFTVRGLERLPAGPCVLVSNHGSYLDGVVLMAALPRPFSFVAKRELKDSWVTRFYLQRLGTQFVERFDPGRSVADATAMADVVAGGGSLAVFPEGTFVADDALLPFRLGAFLAAARAGVPVVPVALRGVRGFLPDGAWWPRRAAIHVEVCDSVLPAADASDVFAAAVRMRDAARRAILRHAEKD